MTQFSSSASSPAQYDVIGIGNALVDVLSQTSETFLAEQYQKCGMERGSMNLVSEERALDLYSQMGPAIEMSGGSVANSMAHLAALGGRAAYMGKVADDQLGDVFAHDMKSMGIAYATQRLSSGAKTGRCMILVSDDATRTMNTYLGAATQLTTDDITPSMIAASSITFMEGYLFDAPHCKDAFYTAGKIANEAGRKVALSLSDLFCVERHHADFKSLIENHIDILFANETEIKALAKTDELDGALSAVRHKCDIVVVTLGAKGSVILSGDHTYDIKSVSPEKLVDTTGAGDAYAAGFLYGLTKGLPLTECGTIAARNATSVLGYMGPRPLKKAAAAA